MSSSIHQPEEEKDVGIDVSRRTLEHLDHALAGLRRDLTEPVLSVSEVVDPLLDVRDAARRVHPWVALPVERLLPQVVQRGWASSEELATVGDEVSLLALEMRSLRGRPSPRPWSRP